MRYFKEEEIVQSFRLKSVNIEELNQTYNDKYTPTQSIYDLSNKVSLFSAGKRHFLIQFEDNSKDQDQVSKLSFAEVNSTNNLCPTGEPKLGISLSKSLFCIFQ